MIGFNNNEIHLMFWLMLVYQYLLRFSFSQNITSFSSSSLTYDSTTLNLLPYTHSQGLLGVLSQNNLVYIQNLNHSLQEQGLSLIVGLLFSRVVYVNPGTSAREYLFGFTSEYTIEGYSIPVIDSTNNQGANLFFRDKQLFSIRYTSNPVIPSSLTNYLGFNAFYDSFYSTSSQNIFSFFLCTASNGLLQATSVDLKTLVIFTAYQPATSIGVSSCSSLSKISDSNLLLNGQYICDISTKICQQITQISSNPSRTLLQNGIIRTTSFSQPLSSSTNQTYTWLSSSQDSIEYIFDYKNTGVNLLFIVQESTGVSLQIRNGLDDTQLIFKGYLNGLTTLNSMKVLYESSQELYFISTLFSSTAEIKIFCIDSSYNSSTFTCTNTNIPNCIFESETKCLQCSNSYYADSSSGLCRQCNSKCLDGCSTQTICKNCQGLFRNPADACQCITPRIEPTRLLQQQITQKSLSPRQLSSIYDCVCPPNQIVDTNQNCLACTAIFGISCVTCNQLVCTSCLSNAYLQSNGICLICSSFDVQCESCDSLGCLTCGVGFYLNSNKTCTSCSLDLIGCNTCYQAGICSLCNSDYYLNSSGTCSPCSPECVGGCISELICKDCASLTMDKTNQCACTGGRIKTTSSSCECDTLSYWDENTTSCKLCTGIFSNQCLACNAVTCTKCENLYYVSSVLNGKCDSCSNVFSNCLSCQQDKCTTCAMNFFVNNTGSCSPCSNNCLGGCSSDSVCTRCSDTLRDPNNACDCAANRVENSSTFVCECPSDAYEASPSTLSCPLCTNKFGTGCLSCTLNICTECSSKSYYYSPDDMKCGLCSADFGETCLDCSSSGCNTCSGGATVNSLGICACGPTQFFMPSTSTSPGVCKECSVIYASSCKSCNSSTCLDCGDPHSIYNSSTNQCLCIDSYFLSSTSSEALLCLPCANTFNSQCISCNLSECISCSDGYSVNILTKVCECPESSTIVSQTCQPCTELYGSHCLTCDNSTCLTCDSPYRIPSLNCSCRSSNAMELNDQCLQCDLTQSNSSSLALTLSYSFSLDCNFSSDPDYSSAGVYSFYIQKSFSAIYSSQQLHTQATQASKILISQSSTISNIPLPHGEITILATYTNTNHPTLEFSITTNFNVTKLYTNFSDIYTKYFQLQTPLELEPTQAILYLSESLEIKQLLSDISLQQTSLCQTLSSDGSLCTCVDTDKFFFDCSGNISDYEDMQSILVQYVQFMNSRENVLTSLQQSIFTSTLNFLNPLIDTSFLATHSTQISLLFNHIAFQLTLIDGSTYLPTNTQEIAETIVSSINLILTSSITNSENIQSALTILSKLQDAVLLTINPFYTQTNPMPYACLSIESTYLVLQQQLYACSSSSANITNITLSASLESSSRQRILDATPNCQLYPSTDGVLPEKYYFGLSKAIFKQNPEFRFTNVPYADQDFEYFEAKLQPFTSSRRTRRTLGVIAENHISNQNQRFLTTLSSDDKYLINFPVITSNPKNTSMTLDSKLLRCIYLNKTTPTNTKWSKCLSHSYISTSNTLICRCPSQATYVFDYNYLFEEDSQQKDNDSTQEKQTNLIIVAAVLAGIFITVIIVYAILNKETQPAEYELAQIRQNEETNSLAAVDPKLQGYLSQSRQVENQNLQGMSQHFNSENNEHELNPLSLNYLPNHMHPKLHQFHNNHLKSSCFSPVSLSNNVIRGNTMNDSQNNIEWNEQVQDNPVNESDFGEETIFDKDNNQTFAHVAEKAEKNCNDSNGYVVDCEPEKRIMDLEIGFEKRANNSENILNQENKQMRSQHKQENLIKAENSSIQSDKVIRSKLKEKTSTGEFVKVDNSINGNIISKINKFGNSNCSQTSKNQNSIKAGMKDAYENLGSLMDKNISLIKSSADFQNQQQKDIQVGFTGKTIDRSISSGVKTNELLLNFEIENTKNIEINKDISKQSNSKKLLKSSKNCHFNNTKEDDDDNEDQEDQTYFDEHHKVVIPNITQFSPTHSSFSKLQVPVSISLIASAQRIPIDKLANNRKSSNSDQRNLVSEEDLQKDSNENSKELIEME